MTVRLRIEGTPEEIQHTINWLKSTGALVTGITSTFSGKEPDSSWVGCKVIPSAIVESTPTVEVAPPDRATLADAARSKAISARQDNHTIWAAYYDGYADALESLPDIPG